MCLRVQDMIVSVCSGRDSVSVCSGHDGVSACSRRDSVSVFRT